MSSKISKSFYALLFSSIGALVFYSLENINNIEPTRITNSDGRMIQVWIDQVECEKSDNCSKCITAVKNGNKFERLQRTCPVSALQWKYE